MNKHFPGQSASIIIAFEFFGMLVSLRNPSIFWGGGKVVLVFEIIYLIFYLQGTSTVKRLRQSTVFSFKILVIDSLPLMGRYLCKQISPFWLDNRYVHCAGA